MAWLWRNLCMFRRWFRPRGSVYELGPVDPAEACALGGCRRWSWETRLSRARSSLRRRRETEFVADADGAQGRVGLAGVGDVRGGDSCRTRRLGHVETLAHADDRTFQGSSGRMRPSVRPVQGSVGSGRCLCRDLREDRPRSYCSSPPHPGPGQAHHEAVAGWTCPRARKELVACCAIPPTSPAPPCHALHEAGNGLLIKPTPLCLAIPGCSPRTTSPSTPPPAESPAPRGTPSVSRRLPDATSNAKTAPSRSLTLRPLGTLIPRALPPTCPGTVTVRTPSHPCTVRAGSGTDGLLGEIRNFAVRDGRE